MVEDTTALVVKEDDFLLCVIVRENCRLKVLGHELSVWESDGVIFFSRAGIQKGDLFPRL